MKIRTIVGTLTILGGFTFFGAGGYVLHSALERNASDVEVIRLSEASCREQIVKLGTFVPKPDDVVEVILQDMGDPRRAMADLTSIVAACPTRDVSATCIGTTCSPNGSVGKMIAVVTLSRR